MDKSLFLLVRPARLERATYGLEGRCSIQLSYERILKIGYDTFDLLFLKPTTMFGETQ